MRTLRSVVLGGVTFVSILLLGTPSTHAQSATCSADWASTFGSTTQGDRYATCSAVFDDGTGPALYVGGDLTQIVGLQAEGLARFDGATWTVLPGARINSGSNQGLSGVIRNLVVYDDGAGPALYAGGRFDEMGGVLANNIAKWDGNSWSSLGAGVRGLAVSTVCSMEVFPGPSGDELAVAGSFTSAGPFSVNNVARWNGTVWRRLGGGTNGTVLDLAVFDGGSGPELHAVGSFSIAAPSMALSAARWDGTNWNALGTGIIGVGSNSVLQLEVYDDGGGAELYVAGSFFSVGGMTGGGIAKWDGTTWSQVGGTPAISPGGGTIASMEVYNDGQGSALFVGGTFTAIGGIPASGVARLDGGLWSAVGNPSVGPQEGFVDLNSFDDGASTRLVGLRAPIPSFSAGGGLQGNVFSWEGQSWEDLAQPAILGLDAPVDCLLTYRAPGQPESLIVGGSFTSNSGAEESFLARWDGAAFRSMGANLNGPPTTFAEYDDGSGTALYVAGRFTTAGGTPASGIARWDGVTWSPLGSGIAGIGNSRVEAMTVYDDGQGAGPRLIVGGLFDSAGGQAAASLAAWDGTTWSSLALPPTTGDRARIFSLVVFDDGSPFGEALYVGGRNMSFVGLQDIGVVRWNGTIWSGLSPSLAPTSGVASMVVHDDGVGPRLFIGGDLQPSGGVGFGVPVAAWNGTQLNFLATDTLFGSFNGARTLHVFDDGNGAGSQLFAGGSYEDFDGIQTRAPVRWDGQGWSPLPGQFVFPVNAMATLDLGVGPALVFGGEFPTSRRGDPFLAAWQRCGFREDFCFGDGGGAGCTLCPCGNDAVPGTVGGCLNSAARSARLLSSGTTDVVAGDLRFEARGILPGSFGLLVSGNAALPAMGPCPVGSGVQSPPFDGLRCVGLGILRHSTRAADALGEIGTTSPGWGPPDSPQVGFAQAFGFVAGQSRFFQVIYRDDPMAVCGRGLNTTNATRVLFR